MVSRQPRSPLVRPFSPGYTLIELMVVVMIAILLMVVSLPVAKTVMENGRPREASRIVNTALFTAKARAASSGRLAGVEFVLEQAAAPGSYRCTQMYMCEVPAIYMGDTTQARLRVDTSSTPWEFQIPAASGSYLPSLLGGNPQLWIRVNHRGPWYPVNYASNRYTLDQVRWVRENGPVPIPFPPTLDTNGYPFQVRRPPVRIGNPIELPKSTAIDMTVSGTGPSGTEFSSLTPSTPLQIMFAPAGNAYFPGDTAQGTIHLLIGLTTKVDATALTDPERSNLADGNALWVSIGRMSGIITTNENVPGVGLPQARQFATNREQQGGL